MSIVQATKETCCNSNIKNLGLISFVDLHEEQEKSNLDDA